MADFDVQVHLDVQGVILELRKMAKEVKGLDKKKMLEHAAQPYISAAKALAPRAEKEVLRYKTTKLNFNIRAPKGSGNVQARYLPGNLAGSIQVLKHGRFRNLENVLYVGAKVTKRGSGRGTFGRGRFDGWYVHFVEYGTRNMLGRPFLRPAWAKTKDQVFARIRQQLAAKLAR